MRRVRGFRAHCCAMPRNDEAAAVRLTPPAASQPASEILDVLPGRAAGAGAARRRPFQPVAAQFFRRHIQPEMAGIAVDHLEILVLAAFVEAEPEAEAIGQRDLFLDRLARIDRGRALVVHHVARQQVAAIRGGVKHDIVGAPLDAAVEHRLQRFVGGVVAVEGEIVAEDDRVMRVVAQQAHQRGQALDILAMDLDQLQRQRSLGEAQVGIGMNRLDQRGLAHAARPPEQHVVGRQALGEALGILGQRVADAVDAAQERERDAVDLRHRHQLRARSLPDEGIGGLEVRGFAAGRGDAFERVGDAQQRGQRLVGGGFGRGHGSMRLRFGLSNRTVPSGTVDAAS